MIVRSAKAEICSESGAGVGCLNARRAQIAAPRKVANPGSCRTQVAQPATVARIDAAMGDVKQLPESTRSVAVSPEAFCTISIEWARSKMTPSKIDLERSAAVWLALK